MRQSNLKQSHDSLGRLKRSADEINYFKKAKEVIVITLVIIYRVVTSQSFIIDATENKPLKNLF